MESNSPGERPNLPDNLIERPPHHNTRNKNARRIYHYDPDAPGGYGEFWGGTCGVCNRTVQKHDLAPRESVKDGYILQCRPCATKSYAEYQADNRDAYRAYMKSWYEDNREGVLARARQWTIDNPGATAKRRAIYSARTTEQISSDRNRIRPTGSKQCRKCRESLPFDDFYADISRDDGLRTSCIACYKRLNKDKYRRTWIDYWESKGIPLECIYCAGPYEHADHFIPIARGGPDDMSNIFPSCGRCNWSKNVTPVEYWYPRFAAENKLSQTLEELLSKIGRYRAFASKSEG